MDCPCGCILVLSELLPDTSAIASTFRLCRSSWFQLDVEQRLRRTLFHLVLVLGFFLLAHFIKEIYEFLLNIKDLFSDK
jgi:hypothetical protein